MKKSIAIILSAAIAVSAVPQAAFASTKNYVSKIKSVKVDDEFNTSITMDEFKEFSDIIEDDIYNAISMETCVNDRKVIGGPAKEVVEKAIADAKEFLAQQ